MNEADLYEALSANIIRAAYFDVLLNEPPKEDEPLLSLPNFYATPHIAIRSGKAVKQIDVKSLQAALRKNGAYLPE